MLPITSLHLNELTAISRDMIFRLKMEHTWNTYCHGTKHHIAYYPKKISVFDSIEYCQEYGCHKNVEQGYCSLYCKEHADKNCLESCWDCDDNPY